ncbi:MAG: cytochrome-c oxidase, cbb3-type subunit II, partial [Pseudobdellovibrionaceae bacterium]
FLGLMYYYLPKAADRPIYSYRLSIIHFWALVFIYIWAGPHHLLYTSLPEWAQTLGMIFSLMLWAPSWGGMINGLLTLRGAWHLLRTDPVIKFFVAAITFYGMATFEGPLLSIKSVSSLAHYTDWIVAHVHGGALGWNGFLTFGMIYFLVPRLWNTKLYSVKLANTHFWLGFLGIVLYYLSMLTAGITQGLMWRAITPQGRLMYPDFVETVVRIVPLYWGRAAGGALFIAGFAVMVYNIWKTIRQSNGPATSPVMKAPSLQASSKTAHGEEGFHRKLEGMTALFTVLTVLAVLVGSIIEIYPTLALHKYLPEKVSTRPYSALELAGRDLYVKEGCYTCHSQQIRPIASEVLRYGKASTVEESMYDRPFQWGSKRTGPDLSRVGKKYPDLWHFQHMMNPRAISPQSVMPNYPWLAENNLNFLGLRKKLSVMKNLGVPYSEDEVVNADIQAEKQAKGIAEGLQSQGAPAGLERKEIVALIAYLQALGQMNGETKK